MSVRDPKHKALIDALVDGEENVSAIAKRSAELGATHGQKLTNALRNIMRARAEGRITPANAKKLWREVWMVLSLGVFAQVAPDVAEAKKDHDKVIEEAEKLGPDKLKVSPLGNADKLARAKEKADGGQA